MADAPRCSVDECDKPAFGRGWCSKHYERWKRHGAVGDDVLTNPKNERRLPCSVDGCDTLSHGWGLCVKHHRRMRDHGSTDDPRPDLMTRIMEKVDKQPNGCWIWIGAMCNGYGRINVNSSSRPAYRVLYELTRGELAAGLELDHLCVIPACVNPDHLEPVTHQENMRRGPTNVAGRNAAKTQCPHGHPYDETNTLRRADGNRVCRECNKRRSKAAYERRKITRPTSPS